MAGKSTVGIVQMCATADVAANVDKTLRLVADAAAAGAEVVLVPEAFAFIGSERERNTHLEHIPQRGEEPGPILGRCIGTAQAADAHLVLGGFPEQAPVAAPSTPASICDRTVRLPRPIARSTCSTSTSPTARGCASRGARHRAIALSSRRRRSAHLASPSATTFAFRCCTKVLADLGAVAIAVPSAFFKNSGKAHWHALLRARAIECQCYILAPAQHGDHGHRGRKSYGHGLVVDPWGDIVAEIEDGDGFALTDVDPKRVDDVRAELPSF